MADKKISDLTTATLTGTESVPLVSGGVTKKATTADIAALTDLSGRAPTTRLVSAGTGLTGGGDLSADRSLACDFGLVGSVARVGQTAAAGAVGKPADVGHVHQAEDVTARTAASTLDGSEVVGVSQGGNLRKTTLATLAALSGGGLLYGAGINGSATISSNTTLTEAKQYTTLTVSEAILLAASGYSVDARTSITLGARAVIHNDGTSATGQSGAASGNTGQLGGTVGVGGNGGSNGGGAVGCGGVGSVSSSLGGNSGGGGAASWPASSACTANVPSGSYGRMCMAEGYYLLSGVAQKIAGGASGSGGSSGASGQAGGGGGGGGGVLLVRAPSITLGADARISCNGGAGADAVGTNAGGGGGGGGGVLIVICDTLTMATTYSDHFKCDGGAAGAGTGTGSAGQAGSQGRVFVFVAGRLVYSTI